MGNLRRRGGLARKTGNWIYFAEERKEEVGGIEGTARR